MYVCMYMYPNWKGKERKGKEGEGCVCVFDIGRLRDEDQVE